MANYLITEEQLNQIIGFVNEEEKITKGSAMRKIVSTLLSKGFDKEDVVDFLIKLRTKDPIAILQAKQISDEPEYVESVGLMMS